MLQSSQSELTFIPEFKVEYHLPAVNHVSRLAFWPSPAAIGVCCKDA